MFLVQSETAGYPNPDEVQYWCDYAVEHCNLTGDDKRPVAGYRQHCRK